MAMTQHSIVVGVFRDAAQARQAIDELHHAGFSENEVGYLTRVGTIDSGNDVVANATTGAAEGGVIGGLLGAASALLIPGLGPAIAGGILAVTLGGAALGAAAGGFIGSLTNMGVTEKEADFYQKELEAGRTIVTVKAANGYDEAEAILRRNGAYDAKTQFGAINATPPLRPYGAPPDTYDPTVGPGTDEDILPPTENQGA